MCGYTKHVVVLYNQFLTICLLHYVTCVQVQTAEHIAPYPYTMIDG